MTKRKNVLAAALLSAVTGAAWITAAHAGDAPAEFTDELRNKCQDYKLAPRPLTREEADLCQAFASYTS